MPGKPTPQARAMMTKALKPRSATSANDPAPGPPMPPNIRRRPIAKPPMRNIKGDRPDYLPEAM